MVLNYTHLPPEDCDFYGICTVEELPEGERLFFEIDEQPIVIFNIAGGLFAIGDVCSHDDGPLGDGMIEDYNVVCPRHGAEFDVRTGKVMQMPAVADIPAYPVVIDDNKVYVGIPKK